MHLASLLSLVHAASFTQSTPAEQEALIPPLAQMPYLNTLWHMFNMLYLSDNLSLHRKFYMEGENAKPFFRFSVLYIIEVVSIADPAAVKHVLEHPELYPHFDGGASKETELRKELTTTHLLAMNGEEIKYYRKILHHAFTGINSAGIFEEVSANLCKFHLEPNLGRPVEVIHFFQRTAIDAMCKSLFGFDPRTLTDESTTMLSDYQKALAHISDAAEFYTAAKMKQAKQEIAAFKTHLSNAWNAHDAKNSDSRFMISVLKRKVEVQELSEQQAIDLMSFMFVAGQETTAATLSAMAYYLAKHQVTRQSR